MSLSAESASVSCPASTSGTLYTFITSYPNQGLNPIPTYLYLFYFYPLPEPGFVSPPRYNWCAVGERLGYLVVVWKKKMVIVVWGAAMAGIRGVTLGCQWSMSSLLEVSWNQLGETLMKGGSHVMIPMTCWSALLTGLYMDYRDYSLSLVHCLL